MRTIQDKHEVLNPNLIPRSPTVRQKADLVKFNFMPRIRDYPLSFVHCVVWPLARDCVFIYCKEPYNTQVFGIYSTLIFDYCIITLLDVVNIQSDTC